MADSQGSVNLTGAAAATAVAPAVDPVKNTLAKPTEGKGAPDNRSKSSRDSNQPPPPKKVRVEDRSVKPRKLNGSSKEKLHQPSKQQQSYSSFSSVPATGGSQPLTNTHKVFKQSDFFLHKPPSSSSSKPKKPSKDKQRETEREKGKGGGEEKKKQKQQPLLLTFGPGSNVRNNNISRFNNISAVKRENGEVMLPPKGRPSHCLWFNFTLILKRFRKVLSCIYNKKASVQSFL